MTHSSVVEREDAALIDALDDLSEGQAARIASILRQHELLFGRGMVLGEREAIVEDDSLIDALRFQEPPPVVPPAPISLPEPPDAWRPPPPRPPIPRRLELRDRFARYRLFGRGRRRSIDQGDGIVALWCRGPASLSAALLLIPLSTVQRHALKVEPVQFWISGPVHYLFLEPFGSTRSGHPEWPSAMGAPPHEVLAIRTTANDRICLGTWPLLVNGPRHVVAAGIYPYFFPGGAGHFERLVSFLAHTFSTHIAVTRNDADGIAWFAARRILGLD